MITVPVSCCVQDVFSGVWSWVGDDELHYTKDNSDLRSGAKDALHGGFNRAGVHVDHHRCVNDTLHFDVPSSAPALEQCMLNGGMALALVDSGSDTDLALGEIGANDAFVQHLLDVVSAVFTLILRWRYVNLSHTLTLWQWMMCYHPLTLVLVMALSSFISPRKPMTFFPLLSLVIWMLITLR